MYFSRYRYRAAGVDAADTAIFAMRNPVSSGKLIEVLRVVLTVGFDGVSALAELGYGVTRFSGASPTGGTSPVRAKRRSGPAGATFPTSVVTDASIKEGAALTLAAAFEGHFHENVIPATTGTVLSHFLEFFDDPFSLETGEGIAIRNTLATIAGTTVSGSVWWREVSGR